MRYVITIPEEIEHIVRVHLFQSEIEQGAFLFARVVKPPEELSVDVADCHLIAANAWDEQSEYYLELKNSERAVIMKQARDGNFAAIECHSHPGSGKRVRFSPSDTTGIARFALYAKWKLDGKPYGAMVWGESSVDAVVWHGGFAQPMQVNEVRIVGPRMKVLIPRATWRRKRITPDERNGRW